MTDQTPIANQTNSARTIRVSQGLFVLRYASSKAGLNAPTVSVNTLPGSGVDVIARRETVRSWSRQAMALSCVPREIRSSTLA